MDPETIFLSIGLLITIILTAMLTVVKVVFTHIESYQAAIKDQKRKFIVTKVELIMAQRPLFASIISLGKALGATSSLVFVLLIINLLYPNLTDKTAYLLSILTTASLIAIFAYSIPKSLATARAEALITIAHIYYWFIKWPLYPLAYTMTSIYSIILKLLNYDERLSFLTEDEKERLAKDADKEESLDKEEREMIRNIFEFGDTTVNEIMVPRIDVKSLSITDSFEKALETISSFGHSRIPVYNETIDSIEGILYAKDILKWFSSTDKVIRADWDLKKILRTPFFVPASKKLDDLMADMKTNRHHIVIVVDEYGGTAGIATMEDMLEEIVGEIQDEYDNEKEQVKQIGEREYIVDPHIELDDLADIITLPSNYEDKDYNTLGGLFYHELGEVPVEGQEFTFDTLHLKIKKMDNQRIEEIILTLPESIDVTEIDDSF